MGSVSTLPVANPRGVNVTPSLTTADNVHVGAGIGCLHLSFLDKTQRDAFASGLKLQGTRHDTSGDTGIRIFYSNNR